MRVYSVRARRVSEGEGEWREGKRCTRQRSPVLLERVVVTLDLLSGLVSDLVRVDFNILVPTSSINITLIG